MSLGEYNGAGSGTTKLLAHLNGNSNDSSGNANNGSDTNITYSLANGKLGQGAGFNGSSSLIDYGNPASLQITVHLIAGRDLIQVTILLDLSNII